MMRPVLSIAAVAVLLGAFAPAQASSPIHVEVPNHALTRHNEGAKFLAQDAALAEVPAVTTSLTAKLGADGSLQLSCEQGNGPASDSYWQWLERLARRKESRQ